MYVLLVNEIFIMDPPPSLTTYIQLSAGLYDTPPMGPLVPPKLFVVVFTGRFAPLAGVVPGALSFPKNAAALVPVESILYKTDKVLPSVGGALPGIESPVQYTLPCESVHIVITLYCKFDLGSTTGGFAIFITTRGNFPPS